ncbi:MAG TPA: energy-coupling factor transporter transmembrane component T [Ktedonobacteraceae bacterium]|nr:energy-coupling factor transporter transmembrane component T [Ktedonobacteraceae bacterium]
MLKSIPVGVYFPGNSLIHRLQSRTKLLALFWIVLSLTIANQREWHFAPYIAVALLAGTGVVLSGISPRELWQRIWLLVVVTLISGLFTLTSRGLDSRPLYTIGPLLTTFALARQVLFIAGLVFALLFLISLLPVLHIIKQWRWLKRLRFPSLLGELAILLFFWLTNNAAASRPFALGPLIITYGGVWILMIVFTVLLVLYTFSLLLTMTTMPVALIEGLTMLLAPLRRLKLPVDDFALMVLLALRFIPTLLEETEQLIKAQTSRGADLSSGTLRERFQSLSMLFVPLIHATLRRASDLAVALEARGYEIEGRQTLLHETTLGKVDYIVLAVVVLVTGAALIF